MSAPQDDARNGTGPDGEPARDRRVFAWLEQRDVPVVLTVGGGHGRPIEKTVGTHANVWRAARERRAAARG